MTDSAGGTHITIPFKLAGDISTVVLWESSSDTISIPLDLDYTLQQMKTYIWPLITSRFNISNNFVISRFEDDAEEIFMDRTTFGSYMDTDPQEYTVRDVVEDRDAFYIHVELSAEDQETLLQINATSNSPPSRERALIDGAINLQNTIAMGNAVNNSLNNILQENRTETDNPFITQTQHMEIDSDDDVYWGNYNTQPSTLEQTGNISTSSDDTSNTEVITYYENVRDPSGNFHPDVYERVDITPQQTSVQQMSDQQIYDRKRRAIRLIQKNWRIVCQATMFECPVCYESSKFSANKYACEHNICFKCYKNWSLRQNTCPTCRAPHKYRTRRRRSSSSRNNINLDPVIIPSFIRPSSPDHPPPEIFTSGNRGTYQLPPNAFLQPELSWSAIEDINFN